MGRGSGLINLITLANVKIHLGISTTDHDAAITAMLPIVSSDVRRILNNNFDTYTSADITSGSDQVGLSYSDFTYNEYSKRLKLQIGQVLYSPRLAADTYVTAYNPDTGKYTISANATGDEEYFYPTVKISQWPTISKMIWYKIQTQTTTSAMAVTVSSESFGPVSKTYADSEINKTWNYPQVLINDLGPKSLRVF